MKRRGYDIYEPWSSGGFLLASRIFAASAVEACAAYLRGQGFEARATLTGDLIADAEAPRVYAVAVTEERSEV